MRGSRLSNVACMCNPDHTSRYVHIYVDRKVGRRQAGRLIHIGEGGGRRWVGGHGGEGRGAMNVMLMDDGRANDVLACWLAGRLAVM